MENGCAFPTDYAEQGGWCLRREPVRARTPTTRRKSARWLDAARNSRSFGGFWQHMLVGEGAIEVALDWTSKPWDLAPLGIMVEEAGGRSTNVRGERTIYTGQLISTNGKIHDEVLAICADGQDRSDQKYEGIALQFGRFHRSEQSTVSDFWIVFFPHTRRISMDVRVQAEKAERFRKLHGDHASCAPNVWDAASARILEEVGYPAIATRAPAVHSHSGIRTASVFPEDRCWKLSRGLLMRFAFR